jgi:uncharacterized protein
MEIPPSTLSPDTLQSIIEEFVSREGTDYGDHEYSLDDKVADVRRLLGSGQAVIVFDAETESCNIVIRPHR